MAAKNIPVERVLGLFTQFGATETARRLGITERNVYRRIAKVRKSASVIPPTKQGSRIEHSQRQEFRVDNGCVIIWADLHIWPGCESTCLRAIFLFPS